MPCPDTRDLHALFMAPDLFRGATAQKVELLLDRGADPNPPSMDFALDADREPAYLLHGAVAQGQVQWVARLLGCGASPCPPVSDDLLDDDTHTPLGAFNALGCAVAALAQDQKPENLEVLRLLLAAGADPFQYDPFTLRTPWEEFFQEMAEQLPGSPPGLEVLAFQAFEAFVARLSPDLAAGLEQALDQGGGLAGFPEVDKVLGWPGGRAWALRRRLNRQLAPTFPPAPSPRL